MWGEGCSEDPQVPRPGGKKGEAICVPILSAGKPLGGAWPPMNLVAGCNKEAALQTHAVQWVPLNTAFL